MAEREETAAESGAAPLFPTETEIYILPDGRVVIADLPSELERLAAQLGPAADDNPAPDPIQNLDTAP